MPGARPAGGPDRLPRPEALARPWLEAYPPGVPPTYAYPDVPLTRFLDDAHRDFPDRPAVVGAGVRPLSYAALADLVDRFAGALAGLGVDHGWHVGVALPPGPAVPVTCFAAWRLAATVVPIHPDLPDEALHDRLRVAGCRILVTTTGVLDRLRSPRTTLPDLRRVVVTGPPDWLAFPRDRLYRLRRGGDRALRRRDDALALVDLVDGARPLPQQRHVATTDPALLTFAPGWDEAPRSNAGSSPPIPFSHRHVVAATFQGRLWVPDVQAGRERIAVTALVDRPATLVLGVLEAALSAATLVAVPGSVEDLRAAIATYEPTLLRAAPEIYRELLADPGAGADLASLRACLAVGGALEPEIVARFEAATSGSRLRSAYVPDGSAGITLASPVYGRHLPGTIGLPVTDTLACVVDRDDHTRLLGADEPGLLLVRGPQVAGDGWLATGDVASTSADGVFTLHGRIDDGDVIPLPSRPSTPEPGTLEVPPGAAGAGDSS